MTDPRAVLGGKSKMLGPNVRKGRQPKLTKEQHRYLKLLSQEKWPMVTRNGRAADLGNESVPAAVAKALYKRGYVKIATPGWGGWGDSAIVITDEGRKAISEESVNMSKLAEEIEGLLGKASELNEASEVKMTDLPQAKLRVLNAILMVMGGSVNQVFDGGMGTIVDLKNGKGAGGRISASDLKKIASIKGLRWIELDPRSSIVSVGF